MRHVQQSSSCAILVSAAPPALSHPQQPSPGLPAARLTFNGRRSGPESINWKFAVLLRLQVPSRALRQKWRRCGVQI
jgi:hypothetical protein